MQATSELRVSPFYHEAKNQIVQPNHFVACSRYFVERWVPRLGGTAVALVLYLRSLGYYNPLTGECRDGVRVSLKQLAASCGCSERTIQRELEKNAALQAFVRVEACYQQSPQGHVQRLENAYRIAMDDPIVPEDAPLLQTLIVQREETANAAATVYAVVKTSATVRATRQSSVPADKSGIRTPKGREASAIGDNLTLPSRQFDATFTTDCHPPGVKLTAQESIQNHIQGDIPNISNNTPSEVASKTDVVAFLANTGVPINDTITATISRDVAQKLAYLPDIEEIAQRQARYLPFRRLDKGGTWGGLWRKSIEGDWPPPDAFLEHERRKHARQAGQAARTEARQTLQARQTQEQDVTACIQAAWLSLSPDARTAVRHEAVSRLATINRRRYQACQDSGSPLPQAMQDTLDSLCDDLIREGLGLQPRLDRGAAVPSRFEAPGLEDATV